MRRAARAFTFCAIVGLVGLWCGGALTTHRGRVHEACHATAGSRRASRALPRLDAGVPGRSCVHATVEAIWAQLPKSGCVCGNWLAPGVYCRVRVVSLSVLRATQQRRLSPAKAHVDAHCVLRTWGLGLLDCTHLTRATLNVHVCVLATCAPCQMCHVGHCTAFGPRIIYIHNCNFLYRVPKRFYERCLLSLARPWRRSSVLAALWSGRAGRAARRGRRGRRRRLSGWHGRLRRHRHIRRRWRGRVLLCARRRASRARAVTPPVATARVRARAGGLLCGRGRAAVRGPRRPHRRMRRVEERRRRARW